MGNHISRNKKEKRKSKFCCFQGKQTNISKESQEEIEERAFLFFSFFFSSRTRKRKVRDICSDNNVGSVLPAARRYLFSIKSKRFIFLRKQSAVLLIHARQHPRETFLLDSVGSSTRTTCVRRSSFAGIVSRLSRNTIEAHFRQDESLLPLTKESFFLSRLMTRETILLHNNR